MASSRVDVINMRIWVLSIICASLTYVNVTVHLVAVHFPGLGFPCAYYEINDLSAVNLSIRNDIRSLTPQLYLNPVQLICYVVFMDVCFFLILLYYIVCCVKVFSSDKTSNINQSTRDITWMGDSLSCFQFVLSMDSYQFFITSLSFRLVTLAAFTYCIFFICFTAFTLTMVTQYQSSEKSYFAFKRVHPKLKGTIKYKTVIINMIEMMLGFSSMVFSITMCLGLGNNFYIKSSTVAFASINTFFALSFLCFLIVELILHRYVKVQFGLHFGVLFGIVGLTYPILKYDSFFKSEWTVKFIINLATITVVCLVFLVCRVVRFFIRKKKQYSKLPTTEGLTLLEESNE
ncbi:envelope glycoprotein M [macacine betaherpesvirus 9]|uniref:Envelope glycoprotein M n=1 Tax=macacine betaherpesvirus 9 TaxID=2560568 RepID=A0A192XP23_9BETA|nr:envelope glycoprotein M [macacine betaherpesvirus 9]ANC96562.1 envelope glycoprotein M [macacine betaherpesvirus 9]